MPGGYDTSPQGLNQSARKGDVLLADAKNGSPKGASQTFHDVPERDQVGIASIAANWINKPGGPVPPGSTADYTREKP